MTLSPYSLVSVVAILAAIGVAWSRRFLAVGAVSVALLLVFGLTFVSPRVDGVPLVLVELGLPMDLEGPPLLLLTQLVASMFLHAGILHLLGNLIALLAFSLHFEERVGGRRYMVIYLASGLAGTIFQVAMTHLSGGVADAGVLVGASGAVAGVIGAFAGAYPNLIIPIPVPLGIMFFFVRARVWVAAIVFTGLQVLMLAGRNPGDPVAYAAHLGGLGFGLLLGILLARSGGLARHKPVSVDLTRLAAFAQDGGSRNALTHMTTYQGEPQVFQAWLERFLRSATCPTCSHRVMPRHEGEMVCTQGHRFDVRAAPKEIVQVPKPA